MASLRCAPCNEPLLALAEIWSRHEFYETDEKLTLSIFDRGADPNQVSVTFQPRKVIHPYWHQDLLIHHAIAVYLYKRREIACS